MRKVIDQMARCYPLTLLSMHKLLYFIHYICIAHICIFIIYILKPHAWYKDHHLLIKNVKRVQFGIADFRDFYAYTYIIPYDFLLCILVRFHQVQLRITRIFLVYLIKNI